MASSVNRRTVKAPLPERDWFSMLKEEALRRIAKNLPDRDPSKDPGL